MLHFFPCHCTTVPALPRRDGGVGRYSRSALPIPSPPGLPGLPQHWPPAALTARWGPPCFHSGKSAVLFSAPGAPLTHGGARQGLVLVDTPTTTPSPPANVASGAARRRKNFLFKQPDQPRQHYFPYPSLLRIFLQGSLSSHRSACTVSTTICLIGVRATHLVQRIFVEFSSPRKAPEPRATAA